MSRSVRIGKRMVEISGLHGVWVGPNHLDQVLLDAVKIQEEFLKTKKWLVIQYFLYLFFSM